MNILQIIIEEKKKEIHQAQYQLSNAALQNKIQTTQNHSFVNSRSPKIITEFKRKSPSKGNINLNADLLQTVTGYQTAGAQMISILTDTTFFGGKLSDITNVRNHIQIPILRKDFIIDPYQIYESKLIGADVILLIAKILTPQQCHSFIEIAHSIGLEVLLELHSEQEINDLKDCKPDIYGINNRDLDTFEMNFNNSINLLHQLPKQGIKIAESGIHKVETAQALLDNGFDGLLIGTQFMETLDPAKTFANFIQALVI